MAKRGAQAGVTLIEMLVVLSIISIAAGVLILRFSGWTGSDPRAEAGRLADKLTIAAETALYSGNPSALIWTEGGYRIDTFTPGQGWKADAPQHLADGMTLRRNDGRDGPLMIAPHGIALPARFLVATADAAWRVDFNGLSAQVKAPDDTGPSLP